MQLTRLFRVAFVAAILFTFVMAVLPQPPQLPVTNDKIQHMVAFATLSVLGVLAFPGRVLALLVGLATFGLAIEIVQAIPMLNRSSDWRDLVADVIAITVSLGVLAILLRRQPRPAR